MLFRSLESEEDECKIVGYALPKINKSFEKIEVRNAFLVQEMEGQMFEDGDRGL